MNYIIKDKHLKYEKALEYEIFIKQEYWFAKEEIKSAKCIFDIWWHIWLFSKWCRTLNNFAEIHYFEPIGELYNQAKFNVWNINKIYFNNCWIAEESTTEKILLNPEKTMQSSKYSSFLNPNWVEIVVNFISLKDYLEQANITKIDVLKMDVEWMEFEIFNSRWDYERWMINNLISEIHLLHEEMKSKWDKLLPKFKNIFWDIKIINSWYRNEIFLLRARK